MRDASDIRHPQLRSMANSAEDVAAIERSARGPGEVASTAAFPATLLGISVPSPPDPHYHRFGKARDPETPGLRILLLRASGR
jgi:hypothetical protein